LFLSLANLFLGIGGGLIFLQVYGAKFQDYFKIAE